MNLAVKGATAIPGSTFKMTYCPPEEDLAWVITRILVFGNKCLTYTEVMSMSRLGWNETPSNGRSYTEELKESLQRRSIRANFDVSNDEPSAPFTLGVRVTFDLLSRGWRTTCPGNLIAGESQQIWKSPTYLKWWQSLWGDKNVRENVIDEGLKTQRIPIPTSVQEI